MAETPPETEVVPDPDEPTVIRRISPLTDAAAPAAPLFAGRYSLVRLLGRGGMGSVYEARDTLVGDVVALKTLELGRDASPEALERFSREVRLARRVSHPHVARTHDLGTHEGQAFLTMEYVKGEDLWVLLTRERALAPVRAARIALAIAEGLAAAHAAGVVHRDLKPANILIEPGGRVVLTDFGIARAVVGEAAARTGGPVGTPMYMAPEQVSGEPVDGRADLYALGLVLFEMLTGEAPFPAETPWATAMLRLRQAPPDLRGRPSVPAPLGALVHHCLGRAPEARPESASEVARVLRDWLARESTAALSEAPAPNSRAEPSFTRSAKQGVAVLPLRVLGPRDSEFLGETLTEALIDQLSRARGLLVQGSGVMARFRDQRDPRVVGGELGVDLVVDGTVQGAGQAVRVSIRLLEARSGTQLWTGRFEHASLDPFELQDLLAPRISEELRGEMVLAPWHATTPPGMLALYRQGRQQMYGSLRTAYEGPLALLGACLRGAPDFVPAVALYAIATQRAWFIGVTDAGEDLATLAHDSAERALRVAPDLVESHLARAMLSAQKNDWHSALVAVRTALDIAPYHPPAMLFLGNLQCEAGRADEGLVHLRQSYELMPTLLVALYEFARCCALRGRMEEHRWAMERLSASPLHRTATETLRVRVAGWMGNQEVLRSHVTESPGPTHAISQLIFVYASALLGETRGDELLARFDAVIARTNSPRMTSMLCQLTTEVLCLLGRAEQALGYFQRAADTVLIDLEWILHCPALEPLRALPGFAAGRRKVQTRCEAIWNG